MKKIRTGFIGGLTNGKIVYDYLKSNKYVDLVVAHTYKKNQNKPRAVNISGDFSRANSIVEFSDKFITANLDLIFVAGWSELLSTEIIKSAKIGTFGFHPSKLPLDRGRSVIAWQVEEGYDESALTLFKYNDYPDGGDIVASDLFKIEINDYIKDVLDKLDESTYNLMRAYFPLIRKGLIKLRPQTLSKGNFRRLRNNNDSKINWNKNSIEIYNKIRAVSRPYPMAHFVLNNKTYFVNKSTIIDFQFNTLANPGTLLAKLCNGNLIFKTKNGYIMLEELFDSKYNKINLF